MLRKELVSWKEIDKLIDILVQQLDEKFDAIIMLNNGGIILGGMLAEILGVNTLFVSKMNFPTEFEMKRQRDDPRLIAWPKFEQFPPDEILSGKKILLTDCAWGTGRTTATVKNKINGAGGMAFSSVLHFCPNRNLFVNDRPNYYAAITDAWIIYPWEMRSQNDLMMNIV